MRSPLSFYPAKIRAHLSEPFKRGFITSLVSMSLVLPGLIFYVKPLLSNSSESASPSSASQNYIREVSPNGFTFNLNNNEQGKVLVNEEGIVSVNIADSVVYVIESEESGYTIRDAQGTKIAKAKFKLQEGMPKFNVYNADGKRVFSGKFKKGSVRIKDENGDEVARLNYGDIHAASAYWIPGISEQHKPILYEAVHRHIPKNPEHTEDEE